MAGLNGDYNVQFVEMSVLNGQHLWGPQGNETVGRAILVFFNANDQQTGRFILSNNINVTQSGHTILIATQAFADLPGAPTPDLLGNVTSVSVVSIVPGGNTPNNVAIDKNLCQ